MEALTLVYSLRDEIRSFLHTGRCTAPRKARR